MSELIKMSELNGGVPLDDATDCQFWVTKSGSDYPLDFDTLFKYIYRANPSESCNGTEGQVITYSEPFLNVEPQIFDFSGLGIQVVAYDENGFTINSYGIGTFGYLTIKTR